jgi:hypothetical protein
MNIAGSAVAVLAQYGFEVRNGEAAAPQISTFDPSIADEHFQWRVNQPLNTWNEAHPRQRGVSEQEADQRRSGAEP